jgi:hypothetical protein
LTETKVSIINTCTLNGYEITAKFLQSQDWKFCSSPEKSFINETGRPQGHIKKKPPRVSIYSAL